MNRLGFQQLANERILEAEALLSQGRWSGAYYLLGYAVESGLKACILKYVAETGVIFRDKKYSEKCWTHTFVDLMKLADVHTSFEADLKVVPGLSANWSCVEGWNEVSRYQIMTEEKAKSLYLAVVHPTEGVLPWIRTRW